MMGDHERELPNNSILVARIRAATQTPGEVWARSLLGLTPLKVRVLLGVVLVST